MELSTPVSFDARTALVVVDMQNDFADPAGSLARLAERVARTWSH